MTRQPGSGDGWRGDGGTSLVEVLVAMALFGVLVVGTVSGLSQALDLSRRSRQQVAASNLATQQMERVRTASYESLLDGFPPAHETVEATTYRVTTDFRWSVENNPNGACTASTSGPSGTPTKLTAAVTVTWPRMASTPPERLETILNPPASLVNGVTGHLAVEVHTEAGQPLAGVGVTAAQAGQPTQWLSTDTDGCAFFAYLEPGTWTLQLDSGHVLKASSARNDLDPEVTGHSVETVDLVADRPATLSASLQSAADAHLADVPVTLYHADAGHLTFPGTGALRSIGGLFPYADGYRAWTGCAESDPALHGGAASAPVPLGGGGSATLPTGTLRVATTDTSGSARGGVHVWGVVSSTAPDCAGTPVYLGMSDAAGSLSAAVSYGHWDLCAATSTTYDVTCPAGRSGPLAVRADGTETSAEVRA